MLGCCFLGFADPKITHPANNYWGNDTLQEKMNSIIAFELNIVLFLQFTNRNPLPVIFTGT